MVSFQVMRSTSTATLCPQPVRSTASSSDTQSLVLSSNLCLFALIGVHGRKASDQALLIPINRDWSLPAVLGNVVSDVWHFPFNILPMNQGASVVQWLWEFWVTNYVISTQCILL